MASHAILLDLDGVLRTWSPDEHARAERIGGLPAGSIAAAAFATELLADAIGGRIDDDTWRRRITERLGVRFPQGRPDLAVAAWSESAGMVDSDVLALVRRCRSRARVILVTNATSRLRHDLERLGLTTELDAVVSSSEVGAAKPHRAIFEAALEVAGTSARHALFIDDHLANVVAARSLGLVAHRFAGAPGLDRFLADHGL